jgi:DNA-binding transcriptional LysR family regulator
MDLRHLESFLRVAERGSLTLAAQELGLTQPGLSRQLQKLEAELGVPLFARTRTGVRLTPIGERCRVYAQEALDRHRSLIAELRGGEVGIEGELRIAASTTPAEFIVPPLIAQFCGRYPNVWPTVFTADSRRVLDAVLQREWDVGFVGARMDRKGLRFDPIAHDEVVLAVPARHPFATRGQVTVDELANQRFMQREDGSGTIMSVHHALEERGLVLPPYRVGMTLSTTQAIVSAVQQGYGVGFVSSLALADRSADRVVAVRLAGVPLRRSLYMVREERRVLPPVAARFVEFALASADEGNGR